MDQPLLDYLHEIIDNGSYGCQSMEQAKECIMYTALWLREEGFWQAANVLLSEVDA
jgi:hypothetical protein